MPVKIILIFLFCLLGMNAYLLFDTTNYVTPFIFKPAQKITKAAFVDYLFVRVFYALMALGFSMVMDKYYPAFSVEFNILVGLFALYIVDYWLFYNDPLTKVYGIPFSYSLIMGVILIVLAVEIIVKWYSLR
jgi:hypothetical protein